MDIHKIFEEFRIRAQSEREKGDLFERFIQKYLLLDPKYANLFSSVWLWMDWPYRAGKVDTGIDLVALERDTGDFWAIQCKFFAPEHWVDKPDIDSFLSASGKNFNVDGIEKYFAHRLVVSSTNHWGKNAEDAIQDQRISVERLRLGDLVDAPIDFSQFSIDDPGTMKLSAKKKIRKHQMEALTDVISGFEISPRGKLLMACGTGKTFTSLKIAEEITNGKGTVLFLVPSISLLSQTLREWTAQASYLLHPISVCSDNKVGKSAEDISTADLGFPATTNADLLAKRYAIYKQANDGMIVIFSTYQSIDAVATAQKTGFDDFDLVVCDEAHRTTGVTLSDDDESAFVKVHDPDFIKAKRRLYMTATSRIYGDESKAKAVEQDAVICSMDDEAKFGPVFHNLGFSQAVSEGLLSDYKVLVLAVDEKYVSKAFQMQLANEDNELTLDDAVKIIGCWNGLSKKMARTANGDDLQNDLAPMRRAVAFNSSIKASKSLTTMFSQLIEDYHKRYGPDETMVRCETDHVDGTYNALLRNEKLDWLKAPIDENTCRILSNARCLSEGVDVPALDAVMFLSPRNSIVDVVQSVGRVMRKSEGKKYGYVILPVGIPSGIEPAEALKDNKKYKIVWDVLQALRAHDDRFNNTINKINLNKQKPQDIQIIGVGGGESEGEDNSQVQGTFNFAGLEDWRNAIYAKMVEKCGDRRYWESWAKDVAKIAENHIQRINALLENPKDEHRIAFDEFLNGLRKNLNDSITQAEAVEMLAQHLITKPVFDALFEGYSFVKNNPVSVSMQKMLDFLESQALEKETETLSKFYESVKKRVKGIDNAEGRQKIIKDLYEKFFDTAFPKMVEKLGIVYTPIEVVDFIIHSVDDILKKEFDVSISDKGIRVLDPFTGTGTFIVRLLQSGLVRPEDLLHKYQHELFANEIVLLAYYIAAVNIEETFHELSGEQEYKPFEGIVLTDTFQLGESSENDWIERYFPENSKRVARQKKSDIRVIIGNPPYSVGQNSANDNNANLSYPILEDKIRKTYVAKSNSTNNNSLYDSYIKAFRWATDRIKEQGIICFVSNGAYIDNNAMSGFRKCLAEEFTSIYCFNLRGNCRTQGEQRRKEKGNVFGEGSRTPIAITLLVKNPSRKSKGKIYYHDIGDYLSREVKLGIIKNFGSVANPQMKCSVIQPNDAGDWINQRNTEFQAFIPLGDKDNKSAKTIFEPFYSCGVQTNRDAWVYNTSQIMLNSNISNMIDFYNQQVENFKKDLLSNKNLKPEDFISGDETKIKWSSSLVPHLEKGNHVIFQPEAIITAVYRPFCKQWLYFHRPFIHRPYLIPKLFPDKKHGNLVISATGVGASKDFSALITDTIPDLEMVSKGQCFPLYYYEETKKDEQQLELLGMEREEKYIKHDAITDFALKRFRDQYGNKVTKEDIFYYVYGILHSPEYKSRFSSDLRKMLPRLPLAKDFNAFSLAGRELAKWHLNYETVDPYPVTEKAAKDNFIVERMRFGKSDNGEDKTTITYNSSVTLTDIPLEAYKYIVNGKSAIEWIMERYAVTTNKDSLIKNDPNQWSDNPRYIIDLLKRVIRISIETVKIVKSLPALDEFK